MRTGNNIKATWLGFMKTGTWLLAVTGTFLAAPPLLDENSSSVVKPAARFAIAALLALLFIPMRKWSAKKYYLKWYRGSLAAFFLSITAVVIYFFLLGAWSVKYYHDTLVTGSHMTVDGTQAVQNIAKKNHLSRVDNVTLVKNLAGRTDVIWTWEGRALRFAILLFFYILSLLLLSFFIASVSQAIFCYQSKR